MAILTKPQVLKKIETFCDLHKNYADAAKALKVDQATLSNIRADRIPVPPKVMAALGIQRVKVYVDSIDNKYLDGSQYIP